MTKKKNPNPPRPRNAAKPKTMKTKKNPKSQSKRPERNPPAVPRKPQRRSPSLTMLKRSPRKRKKKKRNLSGRLAAVLLRLPVPTERSRLMLLVKKMMRSLLRRSRSGEGGRRGLPNLFSIVVVCPLIACSMGKANVGVSTD